MPAREPSWWYAPAPRWQASWLAPAAAAYGWIAQRRLESAARYRSRLPVICVGNFTAGGTGKTPFAIALAGLIARSGAKPWFLSRGYGGSEPGPLKIDTQRHTTTDIGDEPMLLARHWPTVISRDRAAGAKLIEAQAPDNAVIIMDDGLQNPALAKDLVIALVDRDRGVGNGRVIPAGPLRAPLRAQAQLTDIIATTGIGGDAPADLQALLGALAKPLIHTMTVAAPDSEWLRDRDVIAFAGIANPQRFFGLLKSLGARIVAIHTFADHQEFQNDDAARLLHQADQTGAHLVTTEKDLVRLLGRNGPQSALARRTRALPITTAFDAASEHTLLAHLQRIIRRASPPGA